MRRFLLLFVAPPLVILALQILPLALGQRTLFLRDVMNAHLPIKMAQSEALRQGELPLIDLHRSGGQPQLGNPNGLPLYPDNLLLLVADPFWVVSAHFWIHWLLAPFAFYWLGRALGLARAGAWAGGIFYATSGYFLSLLNLYNLITLTTLTPAFVAAGLDAVAPPDPAAGGAPPRRFRWPLFALLFSLILLGGDPFSALLALLLLALALGAKYGWRSLLRPAKELPAALLLGFLLTLPMWVEMLRILPVSFRASIRAVQAATLTQSLHPQVLIEAFFPLFFGRFDYSFWGAAFYDQGEPLIVSLFPGVLALALLPLAVGAAGGGSTLARRLGWLLLGLGLLCALGRFNPLMVLLYQLPGMGTLRFPIKFFLLAQTGLALLAGIACERLLETLAWRRLRPWLLLALAGYAAAAFFFVAGPGPAATLLLTLENKLPPFLIELQRLRLGATAITLALISLGLWLASLYARRSTSGALALLLVLQVIGQVTLLECLYESDEADFYRAAPALEARIPAGARITHGYFSGQTFGSTSVDPRQSFPDFRQFWQSRCLHEELGAATGVYRGHDYELNFNPEGLDSYFAVFLGKGLERRSDTDKVRALAASGVDLLILPRPLAGVAPEEAAPLFEFASSCHRTVYGYQLPRALPPFALLGQSRRAGDAGQALDLVVDPAFDPRLAAILPRRDNGQASQDGPGGQILDLREERESVLATVDSAAGGVFATRRAFLPIYQVEIDGVKARPELLNGHRLGVEVPPGKHQVHLYVDRQPTRISFAVAALALLGLFAWGVGPRLKTRRSS